MSRIEHEKLVIAKMIALYCRRHHRLSQTAGEMPHCSGDHQGLCSECHELLDYALQRLSRCPQGDRKPSCRSCTIHCYSPSHRASIATVMRFSGPRMFLRHPLTTLRHLFS